MKFRGESPRSAWGFRVIKEKSKNSHLIERKHERPQAEAIRGKLSMSRDPILLAFLRTFSSKVGTQGFPINNSQILEKTFLWERSRFSSQRSWTNWPGQRVTVPRQPLNFQTRLSFLYKSNPTAHS